MNTPRSRDFLQSELLRLRGLFRTAHMRYEDRDTARSVRRAIDRRMTLVEDELADVIRAEQCG